jgi:hypothetical protein
VRQLPNGGQLLAGRKFAYGKAVLDPLDDLEIDGHSAVQVNFELHPVTQKLN